MAFFFKNFSCKTMGSFSSIISADISLKNAQKFQQNFFSAIIQSTMWETHLALSLGVSFLWHIIREFIWAFPNEFLQPFFVSIFLFFLTFFRISSRYCSEIISPTVYLGVPLEIPLTISSGNAPLIYVGPSQHSTWYPLCNGFMNSSVFSFSEFLWKFIWLLS